MLLFAIILLLEGDSLPLADLVSDFACTPPPTPFWPFITAVMAMANINKVRPMKGQATAYEREAMEGTITSHHIIKMKRNLMMFGMCKIVTRLGKAVSRL